jgi:hypothetical protein
MANIAKLAKLAKYITYLQRMIWHGDKKDQLNPGSK